MEEVGFMLLGLGFFIFVIFFVTKHSQFDAQFTAYRADVEYNQNLTSAREFGPDAPRLNVPLPKNGR